MSIHKHPSCLVNKTHPQKNVYGPSCPDRGIPYPAPGIFNVCVHSWEYAISFLYVYKRDITVCLWSAPPILLLCLTWFHENPLPFVFCFPGASSPWLFSYYSPPLPRHSLTRVAFSVHTCLSPNLLNTCSRISSRTTNIILKNTGYSHLPWHATSDILLNLVFPVVLIFYNCFLVQILQKLRVKAELLEHEK